MIRRRTDGSFFLITQNAHAALAAELAGHIGNAEFAALAPRDTVLSAVKLHDAGWPVHDDAPTINAAGLPTDVFEMPATAALSIWSRSTQLAAAAGGPYAGLLVSLHGLALSLLIKPAATDTAATFALIKFQHRQIETQEEFRRELGLRTDQPLRHGLAEPGRSAEEDLLLFNFRLLQLCDQLSLNLCYEYVRLPVSEGIMPRPGEEPVTVLMSRDASGGVEVDPWPFDAALIELSVPARRVPARIYRDDEELRGKMAKAADHQIQLRLRA
jgi:hypothetical protein